MKFVFFGTPYPARDTLEILKSHGLTPQVIVTNPDSRQGRGQILTPTLTNVWGSDNNIPVLTPEKLDASSITEITAYNTPLGICVAYGKIIPQSLIDAFSKGILNIHYSLLPKYRGASPVESALLNGDTVTGVTIQKMVHALDEGDIVAAQSVEILPNETTKELRGRLVEIGAELLASVLEEYCDGTVILKPQDASIATHVGKIKKEAGLLDLNAQGFENWNKYRAYAEWPGTYFFATRNGKSIRVKVAAAELDGEGQFTILRVVPEGKKEMDFEAFQNSIS